MQGGDCVARFSRYVSLWATIHPEDIRYMRMDVTKRLDLDTMQEVCHLRLLIDIVALEEGVEEGRK